METRILIELGLRFDRMTLHSATCCLKAPPVLKSGMDSTASPVRM